MITRIKSFLPKSFMIGGTILILGTFFGAVFNFLFQKTMSGLLSPKEYGELTALLSILVILSVPAAAIQTVATRRAGEILATGSKAAARALTKVMLSKLWPLAVVLGGLVAVFSVPLANFFKFDSVVPIIFAIPIAILGIISPAIRGALQGGKEFRWYSISVTVEAIAKWILSFGFVLSGFALFGSLTGIVLSSIVGIIFSVIPYRRWPKEDGLTKSITIPFTEYIETLAVVFILNLLFSIDVLIIKQSSPTLVAGSYAAVSTIAKYLFYFSTPAAGAMFPLAAEKRIHGISSLPIFTAALAMISSISIIGTILFFIAPGLVVSLLADSKYGELAWLLPRLGIMMTVYGILFLLVQYFLIRRMKGFTWILLLSLPALAVIWLNSPDPGRVVFSLTITFTGMALLLIFWGVFDKMRQRQ